MIRFLLAFVLFAFPAYAQQGQAVGPNPTATGQAATGQIPGTATNDNACAGCVGEIIASYGKQANGTVTITNASPAVISDAATCTTNQRSGCVGIGNVVNYTTTGGLPTGLTVGTNYYVLAVGFTSGASYQVATSPFGTPINTSSAGSGTQTRSNTALITNGANFTLAAVSLTAGDWDCWGNAEITTSGTTTLLQNYIGTTHNSNTGRISESQAMLSVGTGLLLGLDIIHTSGPVPISISGTTTYYLEVVGLFSTGTGFSFGSLICRRVR